MKEIITSCLVCSTKLTGRQVSYCSNKCKSSKHGSNNYKKQKERSLTRKIQLAESLGGCCSICGYKKNLSALEFHHLDPKKKSFNLDSRKISNTTMKRLKEELSKCILICSNCHREFHNPSLEGII